MRESDLTNNAIGFFLKFKLPNIKALLLNTHLPLLDKNLPPQLDPLEFSELLVCHEYSWRSCIVVRVLQEAICLTLLCFLPSGTNVCCLSFSSFWFLHILYDM